MKNTEYWYRHVDEESDIWHKCSKDIYTMYRVGQNYAVKCYTFSTLGRRTVHYG